MGIRLGKGRKPLELNTEEYEDYEQEYEDSFEEEEIQLEEVDSNPLQKVVTDALDDLKDHNVTTKNVEDQTDKMVEKVHQSAVIHTVKTNPGIQKKVLQHAEEEVMSSIDVRKNKQQLKVVKATYNANKDACENLGLDDEGRPMWQIKIAVIMNDFWFVVWAIISFFTLTPIIFFLKRVGTQVKSAKLQWVLAFMFYLMIMFLLFVVIISIWNSNGSAPDWIQKFLGSGE